MSDTHGWNAIERAAYSNGHSDATDDAKRRLAYRLQSTLECGGRSMMLFGAELDWVIEALRKGLDK